MAVKDNPPLCQFLTSSPGPGGADIPVGYSWKVVLSPEDLLASPCYLGWVLLSGGPPSGWAVSTTNPGSWHPAGRGGGGQGVSSPSGGGGPLHWPRLAPPLRGAVVVFSSAEETRDDQLSEGETPQHRLSGLGRSCFYKLHFLCLAMLVPRVENR